MSRLTRRGLLGLAAAGALSACTGGEPQPSPSTPGSPSPTPKPAATSYSGPAVTIAFWTGFTGGDGPTMQDLIARFRSEHPEITVDYRSAEWETLYADLAEKVPVGDGPDVAVAHAHRIGSLAARRLLQPMDSVAEALRFDATSFVTPAWAAGLYRDVRYSLPLDIHPIGLFANNDLLQQAGVDPAKPPRTAVDYQAVLDACRSKNITAHWVSPDRVPGGISCLSLLWQFGGEILSDDETDIGWAGEAGLKALTWYDDLVSGGYSPTGTTGDADVQAFLDGNSAFHWDGGWQINPFTQKADLHWSLNPLPNIGGTASVWAGSHQFVLPVRVPQDDNRLAAAQTLISWLSSHSLDWAASGQVPALNAVRTTPEFARLVPQGVLSSELNTARLVPSVPGIEDVLAQWQQAVGQVAMRKADPKTALNTVAGQARAILEQNRRKYG